MKTIVESDFHGIGGGEIDSWLSYVGYLFTFARKRQTERCKLLIVTDFYVGFDTSKVTLKKHQKTPKKGLLNLTTSIQKSICFRYFNGFFDSINDLGIVLSIIPIKRKAEVGKQKK